MLLVPYMWASMTFLPSSLSSGCKIHCGHSRYMFGRAKTGGLGQVSTKTKHEKKNSGRGGKKTGLSISLAPYVHNGYSHLF